MKTYFEVLVIFYNCSSNYLEVFAYAREIYRNFSPTPRPLVLKCVAVLKGEQKEIPTAQVFFVKIDTLLLH